MGNCMFRCGYHLYANTCIGRRIHNRYIQSFQKEFGENAVHSQLTPFVYNELLILPIPVLSSNYAYLVADNTTNSFVLVDVGDATLIRNIIHEPTAILTTHKHWDHSGGNRSMKAKFPNLKVFGGALDHVPDSTHVVRDGEVLTFGRLKFTAIWTPGHTKGHIVWRLHGDAFSTSDSLFTGDHLMLGGCGAAFEGPVSQLIDSLDLLTKLPDDTLVWPGHEAGLENLQLAAFIEPNNNTAVEKMEWASVQRSMMLCTCPSTLGEEKLYNPFLRTKDEALWRALGIYYIVKNNTVPQELIRPLCFQYIVIKSSEMRRIQYAVQKVERNAKKATPAEEQPNQPETANTSPTHKEHHKILHSSNIDAVINTDSKHTSHTNK